MLRVLHVASFSGNIGDNANHLGFRPWFESLVGKKIAWSEYEIRDVYRGKRKFDEAFALEANAHDLVVIGGGNYFELWVDNSPTGTSFSITDEALSALEVPVFFNALGVDAGQGVSVKARGEFTRFMRHVLASEQFFVSVRNDGSAMALSANTSGLALDKVVRLPDAGFFARFDQVSVPTEMPGPVIGINLAGDMLQQRFPGAGRSDYASFLEEFVHFAVNIRAHSRTARFVLFPHIFRDLKVYADLLAVLPDEIRREACRISAYDSGPCAAEEVFSEYKRCDVVLGMRFHANVVAIGLRIPTVGLVCYDQIKLLYDEMGRPDLTIDVQQRGFAADLTRLTVSLVAEPEASREVSAGLLAKVRVMREHAAVPLLAWLRRHHLAT